MSDTSPVLEVVLTGTGVPLPAPGRAGPGALVRYGDIELLFDAGRGTAIRLAEARTVPPRLSAVFLTHHHSDHLVDLPDVVMTNWIMRKDEPLPIIAPEGPSARFARAMLEIWTEDLELRKEHARRADIPRTEVHAFDDGAGRQVVWTRGDVQVSAIPVRHEPVQHAVAYRVDTPAGSVVISGDTRVCDEVEEISGGVDVLVHEACRKTLIRGTPFEFAVEYHADTVELGAMAARLGVRTLMLTHLIPPPMDEEQEAAFEAEVREGGYEGEVIVGRDLATVTCSQAQPAAR